MRATVIMERARRRAALRRPRLAMERCGSGWRCRRRIIAVAARAAISRSEPAARKAVAWGILLMMPRMSRPSAGMADAMARMGANFVLVTVDVGRSHEPERRFAEWARESLRVDQRIAMKAMKRLLTRPMASVMGRMWRRSAVVPTA